LCHDRGIATCFNDAAKTESGALDLSDPITRQAAHKYFAAGSIEIPQNIGANSASGLAIRNAVMAELALAHAQRLESNLIIQPAGLTHVMGNSQDRDLYPDSLCAEFNKRDAAVLMVVPTNKWFGLNDIPSDAAAAMKDVIAVDGLAEKVYRQSPSMNPSEWKFLQRIKNASGGEMYLRDVLNERCLFANAAFRHARALLAKYRRQRQTPEPTATTLAL
jgi:hypothetical protein